MKYSSKVSRISWKLACYAEGSAQFTIDRLNRPHMHSNYAYTACGEVERTVISAQCKKGAPAPVSRPSLSSIFHRREY